MNFLPNRTGAHPVEPVQTSAHTFEQEWLSVEQAVVYSAELGLTRTPKTIRKWAERSSGAVDGDVLSWKEETPWGYRWQIEKNSLTRKVEEELELRSANENEPVRPSSKSANPRKLCHQMRALYRTQLNRFTWVQTRSHHLRWKTIMKIKPNQVRTRADPFGD